MTAPEAACRSALEIRDIADGEQAAWAAAVDAGFLRPDSGDHHQAETGLGAESTIAVFDSARIAATMKNIGLTLSVPGGHRIPAAGLTAITVAAAWQRRGLLTRMMTEHLRDLHGRGIPIAALVSSQWPVYGRFGFGPAVYKTGLQVDARALRPASALPGDVEFAPVDAVRAHAPGVYRRAGDRLAGVVDRPEQYWDGWGRDDGQRYLLCRDDAGEVVGYAALRHAEQWTSAERPDCTARIAELVADTPAAEARLWLSACAHDWITSATAGGQMVEPLWPLLLADARTVHYTHRIDALWIRILDPAAALAVRGYSEPGSLAIHIDDPLGPAGGTFCLDGGPDGATCTRTARPPDITMTVQALGSLYLGGHTAHQLAALGVVQGLRPGALATADRMLRTGSPPWRPTPF